MKDNLEYKGGNPDSQEAYFCKDVSGDENEDVIVENFIWNRKKSNDNIIDTGTGKGFSFYYARHAFDDEYVYEVYNEQNPDNYKTLGIIYENVIVVINCLDENNKTRIISAWEVDKDSHIAHRYYMNKRLKQNRKPQRESLEEEIKNPRFTCEVDKDIVYAYVSKKLQERNFEKIYKDSN